MTQHEAEQIVFAIVQTGDVEAGASILLAALRGAAESYARHLETAAGTTTDPMLEYGFRKAAEMIRQKAGV